MDERRLLLATSTTVAVDDYEYFPSRLVGLGSGGVIVIVVVTMSAANWRRSGLFWSCPRTPYLPRPSCRRLFFCWHQSFSFSFCPLDSVQLLSVCCLLNQPTGAVRAAKRGGRLVYRTLDYRITGLMPPTPAGCVTSQASTSANALPYRPQAKRSIFRNPTAAHFPDRP